MRVEFRDDGNFAIRSTTEMTSEPRYKYKPAIFTVSNPEVDSLSFSLWSDGLARPLGKRLVALWQHPASGLFPPKRRVGYTQMCNEQCKRIRGLFARVRKPDTKNST